MAGALVGGAFLSAVLQVLAEKVASREILDFFQGRKLPDRLLKKLDATLLSVSAVLEDAEEKQVTKPDVRRWIDELKDAFYDAEDILDEIATDALQRKLDAEFETTAKKVRNSISCLNPFVKDTETKIEVVLETLEYLASQKDAIGLRDGVGGKQYERFPTTSLVEESHICGRSEDREIIIEELLSVGVNGKEMSVIAIVGMGGIGKTALAQIVYNDSKVKEHFNVVAWFCVSDEFDIFKIVKTILEKVTKSFYDTKDLDEIQVTLKEKLAGKRFLFVLDDVWNTNYVQWEVLSNSFKSGAQGSKVIVTTREADVALAMRADVTRNLSNLLEEDCWSLFTKHAFPKGKADAYPQLEALGRQIVEKCGGLPLAIKTIGALLRSKLDVAEWDMILKSELWDLPIEQINVMPVLRLSYKHLPSHLKRCFAYCSIFPKDYVFEKNQLIFLWMAEGFLQEQGNKTMEETGDDYFQALVSRSLFQQLNDNKSQFVMHDLVNDLAKFVSGQCTVRLEGDCSYKIGNKTRHLSYVKTKFDSFKKFQPCHEATQLRTFLPLELLSIPFSHLSKKVLFELLPQFTYLRVLSLSEYGNVTELPDSIGKSKHLRYLDLSFTAIKRLPDSICKLCNLQTLKLLGCPNLTSLPQKMWKLLNLRHLDITSTGIKEMPITLDGLKCLQTLTQFVIGKNNESCIKELRKLASPRGKLSIRELQNVEFPRDALDARMKDRRYLEELGLEWNDDINISESQRSVLENLEPHINLKSLTIDYYGGKIFPDWVGHLSFSKMASIYLQNCKHCSSLPPLGQLPFLQELHIVGFDELVTVGPEFYGSGDSLIEPFGALKDLIFENMVKWRIWVSFGVENGGRAFPNLEGLNIRSCPRFTGALPTDLPSLYYLEVNKCPQLVASLPRAPLLWLRLCNEVLLKELPTGLLEITIEGFDALEPVLDGIMDSDSCLHDLRIRDCSSLTCLPMRSLPSTLKTLEITNCMKLELPMYLDYSSLENVSLNGCESLRSFPLDLFPKLRILDINECRNLESIALQKHHVYDMMAFEINIYNCPNFVSFPKGLCASNLTWFRAINCGSLRSLPDNMHERLQSLQYLYIEQCPEVVSLPEGGFPPSLNSISICRCDKLFANRIQWGLQKLSSVRTMIIADESEDVESFPEVGLLPSSLTSLRICGFPKMKYLDKKGIQHLTSLEELQIDDCLKLKCMPEEGLPASLSILKIKNCALLKKQWQRKKGKEWRKIAQVPSKLIDLEWLE
ncbi:hypothetical protein I3842_13G005700 [Carya illinoinensis]|uniref:Disease resistance RPP13-like protein 1 n=1 Tax=Carya illinoinensis TaxID=32201 RepID=A0A922AE49_CARIL|nr:hypothetical protein I3842_13G005700 [Carya illinoinensis]